MNIDNKANALATLELIKVAAGITPSTRTTAPVLTDLISIHEGVGDFIESLNLHLGNMATIVNAEPALLAPGIQSITIQTNGISVVIVFNSPMIPGVAGGIAFQGFTITDQTALFTAALDYDSGEGSDTFLYTVHGSTPVNLEDVCEVSYAPPSIHLKDYSQQFLENFINLEVTNNSTHT